MHFDKVEKTANDDVSANGWQRFRSILAGERFILAQSGPSFSVCSFSTISSILSIILCFVLILHSSLLCQSLRLSYLQTPRAASHLSVCQWLGNWSHLGHKIQVGGGRNLWWIKQCAFPHLFNLKLGLDDWLSKAGHRKSFPNLKGCFLCLYKHSFDLGRSCNDFQLLNQSLFDHHDVLNVLWFSILVWQRCHEKPFFRICDPSP